MNYMSEKVVEELNKCIKAYPDWLWEPDVKPVPANGKGIKRNFWFRCSIKENRLGNEFKQYTHLHFTPHSVSDVDLTDLKYKPPIDKFPYFNVKSGNIISCAESFMSKADWKKHPIIKQLVLVSKAEDSNKKSLYGPLYTGKITNPKKFIEFSNGSNKYYVPRACYYPLLKEDAVNECKWGDDVVYKAMKEMYEALLSYFQKKNGISIF